MTAEQSPQTRGSVTARAQTGHQRGCMGEGAGGAAGGVSVISF